MHRPGLFPFAPVTAHLSITAMTIAAVCQLMTVASAQCGPVEERELIASDGATGDKFGFSVAFDGEIAVISALQHNAAAACGGAAYVYEFIGGQWSQRFKLLGSDTDVGDWFGYAVDVDEDTILVGARADDDAGGNSGSAYVYVREGRRWREETKLVAADGSDADLFGSAVDLEGDTAVISAEGAANRAGAVYVYVRSSGTWQLQQKLTASDASPLDGFGWDVALEGDTLAIGAIGDDDRGDRSGSVYIFERTGGTWAESAKLTASDGDSSDNFGVSLDLESGVLAIGTPGDEVFGGSNATGSVYLFEGASTAWQQVQKLTASDRTANAQFGEDVALDGNTLLVGASNDPAGPSGSGSGYVFSRIGNTWTEHAKLIAGDAQQSDNFGGSVDHQNGIAFLGAQNTDDLGNNSGSAYVFTFAPAGWSNYGEGWPGTLGVPRLSLDAKPALGTSVVLHADNSSGVNSPGALFVGFAPDQLLTSRGGTLRVVPLITLGLTVPASGLSIPASVPSDPTLCGLEIYTQLLQIDPGASHSVSFTPGLRLDLGN